MHASNSLYIESMCRVSTNALKHVQPPSIPACRFILEQLIGPAPGTVNDPGLPSVVAKDRKARSVLERGMVEVDGKPRDGAQRPNPGYWERSELMDNVTDLTRGHRYDSLHSLPMYHCHRCKYPAAALLKKETTTSQAF